MGVHRKEIVHSNILAALMRESTPHGLGAAFLQSFVEAAGATHCVGKPVPVEVLSSVVGQKANVSRELEGIDLLVDFSDLGLVVGVENKIWAIEQPEQLKRYQETLCHRFSGYQHKLMVFLTPKGAEPVTMDRESSVPVYCMSYGSVAEQLTKLRHLAEGPAASFIDQFIEHVETYLSGNSELNDLCWDLFRQHEDAYQHIVDGYEFCVSRKIADAFREMHSRLQKDSLFRDWVGLIEVKTWSKFKPGTKEIVHFDLDVRLPSWPHGLWVKVYKHTWFGVFPYVRGVDIEKLRPAIPGFLTSPQAVKNWGDHYYASSSFSSADKRKLLDQGNKLGETEINKALTKVSDYIKAIDKELKSSGWLRE